MGIISSATLVAKLRGVAPIGRAEYRKVKREYSEHLFERDNVRSTARVAQRPFYRETQGTRRARPLGCPFFSSIFFGQAKKIDPLRRERKSHLRYKK